MQRAPDTAGAMAKKRVADFLPQLRAGYEAGRDIHSLGAQYGFHGSSVARTLRSAGVPLRPGGRRKEGNEDRFWKLVRKTASCWIWTGKINPVTGYGVFGWHETPDAPARDMGVHRCAYLLAVGALPEGQVVRHLCHNKWCVRPDHLVAGSHADNAQDTVQAERQGRGAVMVPRLGYDVAQEIRKASAEGASLKQLAEKYGVHSTTISHIRANRTYRSPEGRAAPKQFTPEQVLEIRRQYSAGGNQASLAKQYNVSQATISRIVRRETWRHV